MSSKRCCSWKDFRDLTGLKYYDAYEFEMAKDRLCDYLKKSEEPNTEVGIVVLMDDEGEWHQSDIVKGKEESVEYDFGKYYSNDPEINKGLRFPQGTVHYHPKLDTKYNYLPSIGDIFNSADMARRTDKFGCGIINHERKGTFSLVDSRAYNDEGFEKLIDEYNKAYDKNDRKKVLEIETETIKYLLENSLIDLFKWQCD